ncbi:MAG: succinylglutamate desuccinylase/aspartoacylase family protein [Caldilineaceae bacterium]|nr:succinylglutamate desuccinylase/aspartoacylase family protein [Caldilineaceae bacterium]
MLKSDSPGKRFTWLPVTTLASGMELRIPVHIVTGSQPGPTLGITAGIHGDEYLPLAVVREVVQQLDPGQLKGTVIALPVVNPLAIETQTRHTTTDMLNLNRVFPGDPHGWLTEQLAAVVCEQFLPEIEYLIDLHAGGAQPIVDYVYIQNDEGMSRAFGFPALYRPAHPYTGTLTGVAQDHNVACVVVEMGGGMLENDLYLARGVRGIYNVLKYLNMLPGTPEVPEQQTVVTEMSVIRPHKGGLLYPGVKFEDIGTVVPRDTLLGTVVSPYTFDVLEEIRAPYAQNLMILLRPAITKVHPGDYAYMVADAASA